MRTEIEKWHLSVIALHSANMFDNLIWPFNLTTETAKQFTFEDKAGEEPEVKGYFAMKEVDGRKIRYFLEDDIINHLPVRANTTEEWLYKESARAKAIVLHVMEYTPFRIRPENCYSGFHAFIDHLAPFEHTFPFQWTLNKMIAVMGLLGKTFTCLSSQAEFGKSCIYEILNEITQKSPVFQPRSIPGILAQITGNGNIVFDEVHKSNADVKRCMENFALQVGANKPVYINGAMKSSRTKAKYDVTWQSITFLYNTLDHYTDPDKEFFDNIFSNNPAIDSRFLKLRMDGVLTEKFDKDFNMVKVAEDNKMEYMKVAKHLLYLRDLKIQNQYVRRYNPSERKLMLQGRKRILFDEITWAVDMYAGSQEEFDQYYGLLEDCIIGYDRMVGRRSSLRADMVTEQPVTEEEVVESVGGLCDVCGGQADRYYEDKLVCADCRKCLEVNQ